MNTRGELTKNKNYFCLTKLFVQFIVRTMMIEAINEGSITMYQLVSDSGWKTNTNTREEAIEKAMRHSNEWKENGCPREIHTRVYYRGELVFTTNPFEAIVY